MCRSPLVALVSALVALALVAGCGNRSGGKAAGQVAAKVNAAEITVHQVNYILGRTPNVKPQAAGEAKRQILSRLIDQQLAKQEALQSELDRSPDVVLAIEAARSEILARAHLENIAAARPSPTEEEVKRYYAEHPELFAKRRVFSFEEILAGPQEGLAGALREQIDKGSTMQDIAAWLKSRDTKFAANSGVRPAEQIPLDVLPKLQEMKDGTTRLFETGGGRVNVIRIVASNPAPIDEATAYPRIQQFLVNRRSSEAVAKEMKRLRDKAQIVYFGEFAGQASAVQEDTAAGDGSQAPTAIRAGDAPSQTARLPQEIIEKEGVRGLR
jgi:EpsD family peptidyl-prolyl cis-trans isomerase